MSLSFDGLVKLIEETGELIKEVGELQQVAAKKIAYFHTDDHPDGNGSLKHRLEDEIADVLAIATFVKDEFHLNETRITNRIAQKLDVYRQWHKEKDE